MADSSESFNVRAVSASLLHFLNQLSPFSNDKRSEIPSANQRTTLDEHRRDVDRLTNQLGTCSWVFAALLHSLDEIKRTQSLVEQERAQVLKKTEELVATNRKHIRLPREILSLIARYLHPTSIPMDKVGRLKSSEHEWDAIVLRSSRLFVDDYSISRDHFQSDLSASSPAKLDIYLKQDMQLSIHDAIQSLLPFHARWDSMTFGEDVEGARIRNALFAAPCPNCLPPQSVGCGDHTVLSTLHSLTIKHSILPSFSGLLKNIKRLGLIIDDIGPNEEALNFSKIAAEAPLLSEVAIIWRSPPPSRAFPREFPGALLPNLKRAIFILEGDDASMEEFEFSFNALDGSQVEELVLHILDAFGEPLGCEDDMMYCLKETFTSLKSLAFRAQPTRFLRPTVFPRALEPQTDLIDIGESFPKLSHLAIEFDQTKEACDTLLKLLRGRHNPKNPSVEKIRSLDLYTDGEAHGRFDPHDLFSKAQAWVQRLTVYEGQTYWQRKSTVFEGQSYWQ